MIPLNLQPSDREVRGFALLWLPLGAVIAGVLLHGAGASGTVLALIAGAAVAVAAVGGLRPAWIRPLYVALTVVTWPIGVVVSTALLAVTFYLLVTPIGLARRALGRDALGLRLDRDADSYWVDRPEGPEDPERVFRQF